jgi:aryl-alcohol dehydrogenase-like predicted oxidoreductase
MTENTEENRRRFLQKLIAGTSLIGIAPYLMSLGGCSKDDGAMEEDPPEDDAPSGEIPRRTLGKTGESISIYSLGGQATLEDAFGHDKAIYIIDRAIDRGINYIDTSAYYGSNARGISERYIGEVMKTRRDEVFLATKTMSRSYDGAMSDLEKSLKNLQTDKIDLWQMHSIRADENVDAIFADTGCLKAFEEARNQGIVRFLGITGHESPVPMKALIDRYPFDTVLMALNAADKYYRSFIEGLLPTAVEKNMGIIGMKIPAKGRIFENNGIITMKEAMTYTLSLPVSTTIIGIREIAELEKNIQTAKEFVKLSADEMLTIEKKAEPYYKELMFFKGLSNWPS